MPSPRKLGKYEIGERLGGHMCPIFKAWDPRLRRNVAIKVLEPDAESERRERLLAEARVSSGLRHPNLIRVLDFGEEEGRLFLVMEYIEGCTLRQAIVRGDLQLLAQKLTIARDLASVLAYIHRNDIIHRDIKPDNIFIDSDARARLIDFGIAKFAGLELTAAGYTLGTPYYMSPEQIRGENLTKLVDVYAYGITLYEIFAGHRPVDGASVPEVFDRILNDPIDPEPLRAAATPGFVIRLILHCTSKDASERPQAFETVQQELAG